MPMKTVLSLNRCCLWPAFLLFLFLGAENDASAATVADDVGNTISIESGAKRIVSLAPHITELLFAAGAGSRLVGTVAHSDYPPAANDVANVGTYDHPATEAILRLRPDLVIAWESGTPPNVIEAIRNFRIPVFVSQPRRLDDVASSIERLGLLAETSEQSQLAARQFRKRLADLRATYQSRRPLSAFYEVWNRPLRTIGGQHIISDVLSLCGAKNIFSNVATLAPTITVEAVVAANPEVIITSGMADERPEWLDDWNVWPQLRATQNGSLFFVPPDSIQRHTPRILDGAELICQQVDEARVKRDRRP